MRFYIIAVLALLSVFSNDVFAQARQLHVGDTLPEVVLPAINKEGGCFDIGSSRDKVLVIYFWSTWCAPCIKSMPDFDAWQRKYGEQLVILPVTRQDDTTISRFWNANEYTRSLTLPGIVSDTLLSTYFPHLGVPHVVWVDTDGVVMGITDSQYLDERNIVKAINKDPIDWPYVGNNEDKFDFGVALLPQQYSATGVADPDGLQFRSLTNAIDGVNSRHVIDTLPDGKMKRLLFVNYPILGLYRYAVQGIRGRDIGPDNRIMIKVRDPDRLIYDKTKHYKAGWMRRNAFCYESRWGRDIDNSVIMQAFLSDLNTYFGLDGKVEQRCIPCFILVRADNASNEEDLDDLRVLGTTKVDRSIRDLVRVLNRGLSTPVFDETGFSENVRFRVDLGNIALHDINALNDILNPLGIDVLERNREVDLLVITDH